MFSKIFVFFITLFTIPSLIVHPCSDIPLIETSLTPISNESYQEHNSLDYRLLINKLLQVIGDIEELDDNELETKYSPEELEKISHLLAFISRQGLCSDDSEADLEDDIEELLNTPTISWEYISSISDNEVHATPAIFYGHADFIPCKSWLEKQVKHTKKFFKKNKKTILIGTGAVVATIAVVCIVIGTGGTTAPAVAAGAAGLSGAGASSAQSKQSSPLENNNEGIVSSLEEMLIPVDSPTITASAIEEQISSLIEITPQELFFTTSNNTNNAPSYSEENTRISASLLAHESLEQIYFPSSASQSSKEKEQYEQTKVIGHGKIDQTFSTDQTTHYFDNNFSHSDFGTNFNPTPYLCSGELALKQKNYSQAVYDFGKVIENNPFHQEAYLDRAYTFFEMGDFEHSLNDYRIYSDQKSDSTPSPTWVNSSFDFGVGFAKGLSIGGFDSGKHLISFTSELICHPVDTCYNVYEAIAALSKLTYSREWKSLCRGLTPEVYHLVQDWEHLSAQKKGEQAGYIFGKYGGDILVPGAAAKMLSKGVKGAKELAVAARNFQTAEKTLVFEMALSKSANSAETFAESASKLHKAEFTSSSMKEATVLQKTEKALLEKSATESFEKIENFSKINWDKQGKHLIDHKNYHADRQRSIFTHQDPEGLLKKYSGTGIRTNNSLPGTAGYKEIVNFEEIIGYDIDFETAKRTATTWGKIHYSTNGAHIVPTKPRG